MSIDESKSDSSKILPKINWENKNGKKSPLTKKEQSFEGFKSSRDKRKIYFNSPKNFLKRSPTNYHLIKILKLNKEELKNNNNDDLSIFSPLNNDNKIQSELFNNLKKKIIDHEFPIILNKKRRQLLKKSNSNIELEPNVLNKNDIYRINHINKKNGNKSAIISNKLIANRILSIRLSNKEKKIHKKSMLRNRHSLLGYSPLPVHDSFSNEIHKNNNNNNSSNTNIYKSINIVEPKLLPLPLSKEKQEDIQTIFISKLNIKSSSDTKRYKRFQQNNYVKKWDLPKSFSFEKVTGRQKEIRNPIKLQYLERLYEYSPKYDSILCNNNKAYVQYNPNKKNDFKQYKINTTRKYVFNRLNIMNSPGNNYNILNILDEQKIKEQKRRDKKKLDKILDEFVYNHKKNFDK